MKKASAAPRPWIWCALSWTVLPNGGVVYAGVGSQGSAQLFLRARDRIDPTLLVASGNAHAPFASPDGQRIAFIDVTGDPSVKAVPTAGGPAIRISSFDKFPVTGATWGDDNTIVFATTNPSTGLYRVPASGGEPEVLTTPDSARGEGDHVWPQFLPQARAVLFTIMASDKSPASSQIAVLDMQTGRKKLLTLPGASQAQYTSSGHLVYAVGSTLFAVPFDPDRLEIRGTPMPLPVEIATTRSGAAEFAIGRDGTLAYVPADANAATPRRLLWVDRRGQEDPIGAEARAYLHPRLSPDGSQIAVTIAGPESRIYAWDFARGSLKRVTFEPGSQLAPVWLDNRVIAYTTLTTGAPTPSTTLGTLFRRAVDGTGSAEEIHTGDSAPAGLIPSSARAGTILLWKTPPPSDILMLGITDRSLTPWYQTPYSERNAELSPNRRWVAFEASSPGESAQFNVYVRPFADPTARLIEISTGGGRQPAWNNDGTELFFVDSDGALDSVRFNPDTGVAGTPTQVLPARYYRGTVSSFSALRMYDVSKDGRFLMLKDAVPDRSTARASIVVTQNWLEELKQLLPSN